MGLYSYTWTCGWPHGAPYFCGREDQFKWGSLTHVRKPVELDLDVCVHEILNTTVRNEIYLQACAVKIKKVQIQHRLLFLSMHS